MRVKPKREEVEREGAIIREKTNLKRNWLMIKS
jgi:hypothetical protein